MSHLTLAEDVAARISRQPRPYGRRLVLKKNLLQFVLQYLREFAAGSFGSCKSESAVRGRFGATRQMNIWFRRRGESIQFPCVLYVHPARCAGVNKVPHNDI